MGSRWKTITLVLAALGAVVGGCGDGDATRHDGTAGSWRAERYELPARSLHEPAPVEAFVPPDPKGRPLLVVLHGRGSGPDSWMKDPVPRIVRAMGEDAPVVVAPSGGEGSYFHDRDDGAWGTFVARDVIDDAVQRFGADRDRVAVAGFSMGGFGALSIAAEHAGELCAAGGFAPAIFTSAGVTAPGAFDDADDFEAHDVVAAARAGAYDELPIRIERGVDDDFVAGQDTFVSALRERNEEVSFVEYPGGHAMSVVREHLAEGLDWYAQQLASC